MKSTNNMAKGAFEKAWKDTFESAKLEPSEQTWLGIEASIANDEVDRYRRGLAYYKWLAAAGLVLFVGLLGYMAMDSMNRVSLTDNTQEVHNPEGSHKSDNSSNQTTTEGIIGSIDQQENSTDDQQKEKSSIVFSESDKERELGESEPLLLLQNGQGASPSNSDDGINPNPGTAQLAEKTPGLKLVPSSKTIGANPLELDPEIVLPALPDQVTGVILQPIIDKSEKALVWAGLNMAPGYFDPNYQSLTSVQSQLSPNSQGVVLPEEDHKAGFSMSFGLEMGMQLSSRWQLSGGVQYLSNNVQSSTNAILDQRTPVFSSVIESLNLADASTSLTFNPTELDNSFQFLSVPVQAGYLILDKRIKLLLNAGIASDFFLQNKISAVDRSLESITITPGSDAPFKSVYFNGLFGAQASYEFLPRYLITLEPRYKMAINDFIKSQTSYSSLPSSFGIGVGVKYVFK